MFCYYHKMAQATSCAATANMGLFTITNTMNAKVVRVRMSNNSIVIWFRNV